MSTTLLNSYVAIAKDLGDNFQSTTDGAGAATAMVDSSLAAKQADWITDNSWVLLTSEPAGGASIYDERKVTALTVSSSTLTTLAFAAAPGTGITYNLNRLFSPTEYKNGLIAAAATGFPFIYNQVRDETHRANNWLKDGNLEIWTASTALTNWTRTDVTTTQTSTTKLFMNGSYSCKLNTAAGYITQSIANNDDLKYLRGQHVVFTGRGWADKASSLRLAILSGTTLTYSSYHEGNSSWDDEGDSWYVEADIDEDATEVGFRVYLADLTATAYVDDLRVYGPVYPKIYIHELGLAQDYPTKVSYYPTSSKAEPYAVRDYSITTDYIYLEHPELYTDKLLRIEGMGYLDFLASGVASTAWTATINLDEPQIKILSAEAAIYLYNQMAGNWTAGGKQFAQERIVYWMQEAAKRKRQFGMPQPKIRTHWGVG